MKKTLITTLSLVSLMLKTSPAQNPLVDCVAQALSKEDVTVTIVQGLNRNDPEHKNRIVQRRYLPEKIDGVAHVYYILFNKKKNKDTPHVLVYPFTIRIPRLNYGEKNWAGPGKDGCFAKGCRWLIIFRLKNIAPKERIIPGWGIEREPKEIPLSPPYDDTIPFLIELADLECGMFQIKDDPLDNRLGVDLELLYEDLQLIISHRPDWASVPTGQLKTDFAKAVLARLLEQTAQQDQSNSERSEVGRQAAE